MNKIFLAIGILIPIMILVFDVDPSLGVTWKHADGYANGGQQAIIDFQHHNQFNATCDPNSNYSNKGIHSHLYCKVWIDGYTAKWQSLVLASLDPSTSASPNQNSLQTTNRWLAQVIPILIVTFIIAWTKYKIKHRVRKHRKRQHFPESIKERTLNKQHHKSKKCNKLLNVVDYDHKDHDRSNNKESNCVALCPNCQKKDTQQSVITIHIEKEKAFPIHDNS